MTGVMEVPLNQGFVTLVDAADYEVVIAQGKWQVKPGNLTNYARRIWGLDGGQAGLYLHTFLTGWPRVDHKNGDGLDNRRINLRPCTQSQNLANSRRPRTNTSGFKGVSHACANRGWRALVRIDGRQRYLGTFATPELAARAYDRAALELFGEFARTNFPRGDYR